MSTDEPFDTRPSLSERVAMLSRLATETNRATNELELLGIVGRQIATSFGVDLVTLSLTVDDGRRISFMSFDPEGRPLGSGFEPSSDHQAASRAAETGQAIHEPDTVQSSFTDIVQLVAGGLTSAVVLPLRVGEQPLGALTVARRSRGFDRDDLRTLGQAAGFTASAIQLERTAEVAQRAETERHKADMVRTRRADEIEALDRMAAALERFELVHAVAVVAGEIASLRGIELCRVSVVGPDGRLVEVASGARYGARFNDVDDSGPTPPDTLAVETQNLVLWRRPDNRDLDVVDALNTLGVTSVFALPVMWDGHAVGAIMAGSTGGHRLVVDEHIVVVDIVGQLLAQARGGPEGLQRLLTRSSDLVP